MRKVLLCITAAGSLLISSTSSGLAQSSTGLAPGARLRLITPRLDASQQTVTVISASTDSVQFRSDGSSVTRTIPLSDISAVEVRTFGERPFLRNMFIGGAIGGALGGALAYAAYEECGDCWFFDTSRDRDTVGGVLVGGLTGIVGGLAVAAFQRGERWTRIPFNGNVALLSTPDGRFAFALKRGF